MTRRRAVTVTVRVAAVTVNSDSRPGAASDFPGRPSASDPAIVLMMSFAKSFVSLSGQPGRWPGSISTESRSLT
jgi:hypothetical protein